jgi:hypothetical protein
MTVRGIEFIGKFGKGINGRGIKSKLASEMLAISRLTRGLFFRRRSATTLL